MTKNQKEKISDNLRAYEFHFEKPFIEYDDDNKGFYVYRNESDFQNMSGYVQFCYNIDYLNGWLYGAVQAKCKQLKTIERANDYE